MLLSLGTLKRITELYQHKFLARLSPLDAHSGLP